MTYEEIEERSDFIARGLLINGFKHKDVIAGLAETCVENIIVAMSMARVGAIGVSVFTTLGDDVIVFFY